MQCLMQLGCSDKHIKFYRANLALGAATLSEIIKAAHLQRSTAYLIASEMVTMGLAQEDHKAYKKLFVAAEPEVLLRKLEAKHRSLGRSTITFKEALPELQAAHHATTTRPSVRTFEDKTGLQAVWKDILESKSEILLWSNQSSEEHIFDAEAHGSFIRERIAKNIPIRVLAVNNDLGRELQANDSGNLRHTKLLPDSVPFTSETYMYDDKVAVLDFGKKVFGVITQNQQIAESQRAIFEYVWAQLS